MVSERGDSIMNRVKRKINYSATIKENLNISKNIKQNIFYTIMVKGIRAFKGRLGYYDGIELGRLDRLTLGFLDELDEG